MPEDMPSDAPSPPGHSSNPADPALNIRPAGGILSGSPYCTLLALVWPLILSNLLNVSVGIVDTYFAGKLHKEALAAIGAASLFFDALIVLMLAIGGGTTIVVARYFGAGDTRRVSAVVRDAFAFAAGVAALVIIPLGLLLAGPVLHVMGLSGTTHDMAMAYFHWRLPGALFVSTGFVLGSAWIGAGDTRTPLAILLVTNLANVVLTPVLMFGYLGAPAMGVAGAGAGSLVSRILGASIAVYLVLFARTRIRVLGLGSWVSRLASRVTHPSRWTRDPRPETRDQTQEAPPFDWGTIRTVVGLGLPRSLEGIVRTVTGLTIVGLLGAAALNAAELVQAVEDSEEARTVAIAAYTVGMSVRRIPTFIGLAFMTATMALVGQSLGARSPERASAITRASCVLALSVMSAGALVMLIAPEFLIRLFNEDPKLILIGRPLFRTLAFAEPVIAVSLVLTGCLRGAGDAMWPFLVSVVTQFGIAIGVSFLVIHYFGAGLQTLWILMVAAMACRALLMVWRFLQGRWKRIEI